MNERALYVSGMFSMTSFSLVVDDFSVTTAMYVTGCPAQFSTKSLPSFWWLDLITTALYRFPHNYVGTTFKPLPGIHEMAAKIRERRERLDAAQAKEGKFLNLAPLALR